MECSKHILTGNELSNSDVSSIINTALEIKKKPDLISDRLCGKQIALLLDKPSLRTKFSFVAGVSQMGGTMIESLAGDRKKEEPADTIRVLQNYCDAVVIRTYEDKILQEMSSHARVPIINALSDGFHPCQALADMMTLQERFKKLAGLRLAYIGDNNNVLHSLMVAANQLDVELHYCYPLPQTNDENIIVNNIINNNKTIIAHSAVQQAVTNCDAVYTDVWTSMGFKEHDPKQFAGFQVNEELMSHAAKHAVFMHCMPMQRGVEVSSTLPDLPCSVIFEQCNNRLHVQKALLLYVLDLL